MQPPESPDGDWWRGFENVCGLKSGAGTNCYVGLNATARVEYGEMKPRSLPCVSLRSRDVLVRGNTVAKLLRAALCPDRTKA